MENNPHGKANKERKENKVFVGGIFYKNFPSVDRIDISRYLSFENDGNFFFAGGEKIREFCDTREIETGNQINECRKDVSSISLIYWQVNDELNKISNILLLIASI